MALEVNCVVLRSPIVAEKEEPEDVAGEDLEMTRIADPGVLR